MWMEGRGRGRARAETNAVELPISPPSEVALSPSPAIRPPHFGGFPSDCPVPVQRTSAAICSNSPTVVQRCRASPSGPWASPPIAWPSLKPAAPRLQAGEPAEVERELGIVELGGVDTGVGQQRGNRRRVLVLHPLHQALGSRAGTHRLAEAHRRYHAGLLRTRRQPAQKSQLGPAPARQAAAPTDRRAVSGQRQSKEPP